MAHKDDILHIEKLFFGLILFIISPVMAAYAAIRNFGLKESRWILILFFGFFGMTMVIQDGKDAKVHADNFLNSYIDKDFKTFKSETKNILLLKSQENEGRTNDDLYLHVASYITGQFSSSPALLFFFVSFIYGIFYIRGVTKVYELIGENWSFALIAIFFLFVFWKSLEGINSIRNWTGAWIFFNGAFSYFQTKNKKYLLLVLLAPLIHFAYGIITIPFFLIVLVGNWPKVYFAILILSFFFTVENVDLIREYMILTELGSQKVGYIEQGTEDYLVEGHGQALHAKYYLAVGKLVISILFYYALLFFGYLKKKNHDYLLMSLASMGVLMISFSNLTSFSIALNNRVFTNGGLFILAYLAIVYSKRFNDPFKFNLNNFNLTTYVCVPLILFFSYTQLSHIGDFTDAKIFVSPLLYWVFEDSYSLKELLRNLFF